MLDPVAEGVDREHRRVLEPGREERAGEVRDVVLDEVPLAVESELRARVRRDRLLEAADRDRIGRREARLRQAPGRRQRRETGDVLHPREALLLRRGDEPAVDDERSGGIAVVRVQAEDRRQAAILGRLSSLSGSVQGPFRDG